MSITLPSTRPPIEAGILIWQDFPLQWLYRREVLPEARRQARQMVRLLYNHPAVAIWCMHNEPLYVDRYQRRAAGTPAGAPTASVFFWNWNRDVLDTQLKRMAEKEDRTRPAVRSSGEYAVPLACAKAPIAHFYFGWYTDLRAAARLGGDRAPAARQHFASSPSLARRASRMSKAAFSSWTPISTRSTGTAWSRATTSRRICWITGSTGAPRARWRSWCELTQDYQIAINRFYIDRLRYYKYRPTGGIMPFMFHDPNPAIQWSIVDYWRVPKRSYDAMRLAFSPQYIFTLLSQDHYPLGKPIDLPIYVVNDAQRDRCRSSWPRGSRP